VSFYYSAWYHIRRQTLVSDGSDISAGAEREQEISKQLNAAQIILLLVSPDFLASDKCHRETLQALKKQSRGTARVIPIFLSLYSSRAV
jgi:hypothetical protein